MIKTIVTHKNSNSVCPDGMASAMILHAAYPDAEIRFVQYGTPEHMNMQVTEGMLFCDMTPPRERMQEFIDAGAWVLDHHATQKDIVSAFGERGVYADEPGRSGAVLALEHATGHAPFRHMSYELAKLAGIRDTWQRMHIAWPDACAQAAALSFLGPEHLLVNHLPYLSDEEMRLGFALCERRLSDAKRIAETGLISICGYLLFNDVNDIVSDVAEIVRETGASSTGIHRSDIRAVVGFSYSVRSDGQLSLAFNLRSTSDLDVSVFAKANGGGGHRGAAGFSYYGSSAMVHSPIHRFFLSLNHYEASL